MLSLIFALTVIDSKDKIYIINRIEANIDMLSNDFNKAPLKVKGMKLEVFNGTYLIMKDKVRVEFLRMENQLPPRK